MKEYYELDSGVFVITPDKLYKILGQPRRTVNRIVKDNRVRFVKDKDYIRLEYYDVRYDYPFAENGLTCFTYPGCLRIVDLLYSAGLLPPDINPMKLKFARFFNDLKKDQIRREKEEWLRGKSEDAVEELLDSLDDEDEYLSTELPDHIRYEGEYLIHSETLSEILEVPVSTIFDGFKDNDGSFIEGEDYFYITPEYFEKLKISCNHPTVYYTFEGCCSHIDSLFYKNLSSIGTRKDVYDYFNKLQPFDDEDETDQGEDDKQLPESIVYKNQIVATTKVLADFLGTVDKRISQNHNSNIERFIEGKHYFKLNRSEINQSALSELVNKHTTSMYLWTERGCARHAKILDTQEAWDLWEVMEDSYFDKASKSQHDMPQDYLSALESLVSTEKERLALESKNKKLKHKNKKLEHEIEKNAPDVRYAKQVKASGNDMQIGTFAKTISNDHGVIIGRNTLFDYFREVSGHLMRGSSKYDRNLPYQRYIDQGLFVVSETRGNDGKMHDTTFITPKGRLKLTGGILDYFEKMEGLL